MTYYIGSPVAAPLSPEQQKQQAIDRLVTKYATFKVEFKKWIDQNKQSLTDKAVRFFTSTSGQVDQTKVYEANLAKWDSMIEKIKKGDLSFASSFSESMKQMQRMFAIPPDSVTGIAWKALTDTLDQLKQFASSSGNNALKIAGAAVVLFVIWKLI